MGKKPKCKRWHNNKIMPTEFKDCILSIANTSANCYILGFRDLDTIYDLKGDEVCETAFVERWCYIDLN